MRLRSLLLFFVLTVGGACGDSGLATVPGAGSSGVPNSPNGSSSSSGGPRRDAGGDDDDDAVVPPPLGPGNVRIVAGNLTSGDSPSYDEGPGTRIFQGLKADVALVQELNFGNNSETAIKGWVETAFGADFAYYRESGAGFDIPNAVVSRFPILESGTWASEAPNRGFAYAKLDVPGDRDLWAVSVHFLTTDSKRDPEAQKLVAKLKEVVKAGEYIVVGGDLNTGSRGEACLKTLDELVDATTSHAADGNGNENTNATRGKPYDWVLTSPTLTARQVPTNIGANTFEKGLVFDSRVYTPIADVAPVKATDSAAPSMQHMAVVKDFKL